MSNLLRYLFNLKSPKGPTNKIVPVIWFGPVSIDKRITTNKLNIYNYFSSFLCPLLYMKLIKTRYKN